jgi:hypothetical protein
MSCNSRIAIEWYFLYERYFVESKEKEKNPKNSKTP